MSRAFPTPVIQAGAPFMAPTGGDEVVTKISPMAPGLAAVFRELWQFRHLFTALVWRNVRVEFDATRLGSAWAISRPILFTIVFVMFRGFSGANTYVDLPYGLYVFSGLVLWNYFLDAATASAGAIRLDSALLTKVYYPRLLTPIVPVFATMVNVAIALIPLVVMMVWYGVHPGWPVLLLPLVLLQAVLLALGIGTLVSSISIENRDWERALAFILSIGLWLSPVVYAPRMIPGILHDLYHLNPMVGLLLAFRAVLFDGFPMPTWEWAYSAVCTVGILLLGLWAFRRTEAQLADRL
jgi:lipopolysaccharide transport system permease protein